MKFKSFISIVMLAAMVVLTGCSKTNPIFETVPADADVVVKFDAVKIGEALDIQVKDGSAVIPDYLKNSLTATQADEMASVAALIKNQEFVMFANMNQQMVVVTALLSEPDKVAAKITEKSGEQPLTQNGYKVWKNRRVVIKDDQMWIVPTGNGSVTDAVASILKRASDNSVADISPVAAALSSAAMITYAGQSPNFLVKEPKNGQQIFWSVCEINCKDQKLTAESKSIYPDGSDAECETLVPINTSALQYVPATPLFTAAAGVSSDFPWTRLLEYVSKQIPNVMGVQAQMAMVTPYLQSIDGTVLMSLGLAPGITLDQAVSQVQQNPSVFRFIMMIHYKEDTARQLVEMVKAMGPQLGFNATDVGNGLFMGEYAGMPVYFGIVDGYLTVANYKPEPTSGSSAAAAFNEKLAGMTAEIPSMTVFNPSANFSLSAVASSGKDEGKFVLSLENTKEKILPALIKLAQ